MFGNSTIIFVHIPKTAGTTLNRVIDREYNPLRIFSLNGRYFRDSYRRLINCPPARISQMQVFRGHMPFGFHKHLQRPATYITVLRDPVQRMISEYYFAVNRRIHRAHREISRLTLAQYVETTPYNNAQTKMIAGQNLGYDFLAGDCTDETLRIAKENLASRFSLVGATERFDESLALAKVLFGWKVRHYASFRITPRRPKTETIPDETRVLLAKHNAFDCELYDYGRGLLDHALAQNRDGVAAQIAAVRAAKLTSRAELLYYRAESSALKALTLMNSRLRCVVGGRRDESRQ